MAPFDLFDPERKSHVKLYVNRVFISDTTKDLIPAYLRFLRGVVDSQDLSLNVSREMLQSDPKLAKIKTSITKKVLGELKEESQQGARGVCGVLEEFRGCSERGPDRRSRFARQNPGRVPLLLHKRHRFVSLSDYLSRCKDGQDAIYYMAGEDATQIAQSPHLEGFRAKGLEVLLLADSVDEFWLQHVTEFEGKPFKSITRGAADLDNIAKDEDAGDKKDDTETPDIAELIASIKAELGDTVKDVRLSKRLTGSPVCLIADEGDMDVNLERILKRHGQLQHGLPRVLELNAEHNIIQKLAERAKGDEAASDDLLKDAAHLLLDQARIAEGEVPSDAAAFARRLGSVMESAL